MFSMRLIGCSSTVGKNEKQGKIFKQEVSLFSIFFFFGVCEHVIFSTSDIKSVL